MGRQLDCSGYPSSRLFAVGRRNFADRGKCDAHVARWLDVRWFTTDDVNVSISFRPASAYVLESRQPMDAERS